MGKKRRAAQSKRPVEPGPPAPPPLPPPPRAAVWLWTIAGILCFWSFGYTPMMGADLWWHLAAGRHIVETGNVLGLTDPWSYTFEGKPWLHHEWLADVLYHGWASLFGLDSLAYWKWGVIVATYLLLMRALRRITQSPAAGFVAAVTALACGAAFLDVRPHLYSLCGFAIVLNLTLTRERPSWALPAVFLVWANIHGGFFFGLMALGLASLPSVFRGGMDGLRRAALIFGACVLASAATPNGFEAFYYPIKYAFDETSPFRGLGEWHPPFEPGGIRSDAYPYVIAVFAGSALAVLARRHLRNDLRISVAGLGLGLLTLAMSLRSRRFIPLFGMAEALVLAPVVAELVTVARRRAATLPLPRVRPYLAPALAIALGVFWLWPYPKSGKVAFHYLTSEGSFPVEIMNFVEVNRISGKVFAVYNWGGYLHLRTDGRLKVFIDGRADTIFDAKTYNQYLHVLAGRRGWMEIVEGSGAEYVLWWKSRGRVLAELVKTGRWRVLYEDDTAQLLIRHDVPPPTPIVDTPPSGWRELALAVAASRRRDAVAAENHLHRALDLMPHNAPACRMLVRVQMSRGNPSAARRTLARCERVFPRPDQLRQLEEQIDRAEEGRG
jgi:hypothetical protein